MKRHLPVIVLIALLLGVPSNGFGRDTPCKGTKTMYKAQCRYPDQIKQMKAEARKKAQADARRKARKKKRKSVVPSPTPAPSLPLISFDSVPPGATVDVGGRVVCVTPCQSGVALGTHVVRMQKEGHAAAFSRVTVQGPQSIRWTLRAQLSLGPKAGLIRTLEGHAGAVTSVVFSPDGKSVLSGSSDHSVRLWNAHSGEVTRVFSGHNSGVNAVAFGSDGRTAVSGSDDKSVNIWNVSDGRLMKSISVGQERVMAVAMSPGGRSVLWGGSAGTLQLLDVQTGLILSTFLGHQGRVGTLAFSPDGMRALSGGGDKLYLWDVQTGFLVRTLPGHAGPVLSVAFSTDGRYGLTGSADHTLKLWDLRGGRTIRTFSGHMSHVTSVAVHPSGRMAMSGSLDQTLKIWEVRSGRVLHTFQGQGAPVRSVAFSRDGRYALSGRQDNLVNVWLLDAPGTGVEERCYRGARTQQGRPVPVITRLKVEAMTGQVSGGYTYLKGEEEIAGTLRAVSPLKKGTDVLLEWTDSLGSGQLSVGFMGGFMAFNGMWAGGQATPNQSWYGKLVGCDVAQLQQDAPEAGSDAVDTSCSTVRAHMLAVCSQSAECTNTPLMQILQNQAMFLQACEQAMTAAQRACFVNGKRFIDFSQCM